MLPVLRILIFNYLLKTSVC